METKDNLTMPVCGHISILGTYHLDCDPSELWCHYMIDENGIVISEGYTSVEYYEWLSYNDDEKKQDELLKRRISAISQEPKPVLIQMSRILQMCVRGVEASESCIYDVTAGELLESGMTQKDCEEFDIDFRCMDLGSDLNVCIDITENPLATIAPETVVCECNPGLLDYFDFRTSQSYSICCKCGHMIEKHNEFIIQGEHHHLTFCANCLKTELDSALKMVPVHGKKCDCCGDDAYICHTGTHTLSLCRKHLISFVCGTLNPTDYKRLQTVINAANQEEDVPEFYLNENHYDPDNAFPFSPDYRAERIYNNIFNISNQENCISDMIYHLHTIIADCYENSRMDRDETAKIDKLEEDIEQMLMIMRSDL